MFMQCFCFCTMLPWFPAVSCVTRIAILLFNTLRLVIVPGIAWPDEPDIDMQDTSRPIVKNHHSVVLRAESAAEKYSWLTRLLAASGSPMAARAKNPQQGSKPPSPEQSKVHILAPYDCGYP